MVYVKDFSAPSLVYLGLGSNEGDRSGNLEKALRLIAAEAGTIVCRSSVIETEPWGFVSENKFLNMVVSIETPLSPSRLLTVTQRIERQLGRLHKTPSVSILRAPLSETSAAPLPPYHDRPIDIDILLYADRIVRTPRLTIPHPLMLQREFVWRPLLEIAPDILWPPTGRPVCTLVGEQSLR